MQNVDRSDGRGDYFNTLGVPPAAGRVIADAGRSPGCAPVAVLSYGFWQAHFGGTPTVLWVVRITLNRQPFEVIGVSARRFYGMEVGQTFDVAVPVCASALFDKRNLESRGRWWLSIMGRMEPGTDTGTDLRCAAWRSLSPAGYAAPAGKAGMQSTADTIGHGCSRDRVLRLRRSFGEPLRMLMAGVALGAAHRLRQHRQPDAGQGGDARQGDGDAYGARRLASRLVRQLLTESVLSVVDRRSTWLALRQMGQRTARPGSRNGAEFVFLDVSLDGRISALPPSSPC